MTLLKKLPEVYGKFQEIIVERKKCPKTLKYFGLSIYIYIYDLKLYMYDLKLNYKCIPMKRKFQSINLQVQISVCISVQ